MISGFFIAGTDTGVGKTALGCGLLRLAHRAGLHPIPYKPMETGCMPHPADSLRLLDASSSNNIVLSEVCPYPLPLPVAPAAAAEAAGISPSLTDLLTRGRALAARTSFLLVESAGGLLTPYGPGFTGADLAAAFGLPVLLAARNALGTINHTALAVGEIHRRQLPLAGIILIDLTPEAAPDRASNAALIESVCGERPLATLPFVPGQSPDALADQLLAHLPRTPLFARLFPAPPSAT